MFFINPFIYAAGADFESIATVTVGSGGAATAVIDNIPGTYQHLQVRMTGRCTRSDTHEIVTFYYNTDTTTTNYVGYHRLYGDGASAGAGAETSGWGKNVIAQLPAATSSASIFGSAVVDILDYASTSKNKTVRSFNGFDRNGAGLVQMWSGLWMSTSAITKITVAANVGNLDQYTTISLYGLRAP